MPRSAQQIAAYEARLSRVAELHADGLETRVIAERLGISANSAKRLLNIAARARKNSIPSRENLAISEGR